MIASAAIGTMHMILRRGRCGLGAALPAFSVSAHSLVDLLAIEPISL
jgi:hypothetical protein